MAAIMAYHEEEYLSVHREFFDSILAAQEESASSSNSSSQPQSETSDHHIEQEQEHEQEIERQESQSSAHCIEQEKLLKTPSIPVLASASAFRTLLIAKAPSTLTIVSATVLELLLLVTNVFLLITKVLLLTIKVRLVSTIARLLIAMARLIITKTPTLTGTTVLKASPLITKILTRTSITLKVHIIINIPPRNTKTLTLISTTAIKTPLLITKIPPTILTSTTVLKGHILSAKTLTLTGTTATKAPHLITKTLTHTRITIKAPLLITRTPILTRTTILKSPFLNIKAPLLITKDILLFTKTTPTLPLTRTTALKDLLPVIKVLSTKEKASVNASSVHSTSRDEYPGVYGERHFGDDNSDYLYDRNRFPKDSGSPNRFDKENHDDDNYHYHSTNNHYDNSDNDSSNIAHSSNDKINDASK
ncbi:hypothetical protein BG005_001822 [Podila minutissima]|nr:hypothetical protein BG005_001822 [Podila minutissima]